MRKWIRQSMAVITSITLAGVGAMVHAQQPLAAERGQLLYTTHCIACHSTQVHWRGNKLVYDWDSLKFQVRRWQGVGNLRWSEADIADVARYLNDSIYEFPQGNGRVGSNP